MIRIINFVTTYLFIQFWHLQSSISSKVPVHFNGHALSERHLLAPLFSHHLHQHSSAVSWVNHFLFGLHNR